VEDQGEENKMEKGVSITCQCLKCGATKETTGHCINETCPKCGGPMRRADRPGPGR